MKPTVPEVLSLSVNTSSPDINSVPEFPSIIEEEDTSKLEHIQDLIGPNHLENPEKVESDRNKHKKGQETTLPATATARTTDDVRLHHHQNSDALVELPPLDNTVNSIDDHGLDLLREIYRDSDIKEPEQPPAISANHPPTQSSS